MREEHRIGGAGARPTALSVQLAALCVLIALVLLASTRLTGVDTFAEWHRWTHLFLLTLTIVGVVVALRVHVLLVVAFAGQLLTQAMAALRPMPAAASPTLSLADLGQVVWGVSLVALLLVQLRRSGVVAATVHVLDAAMVTLSGVFVLWELVISPALGTVSRLSTLQQVMVVLSPALDLFVAAILLLLLLIDRSATRLVWFAAMVALVVGDVVESRRGGLPTANSLIVATSAWAIGFTGVVAMLALPSPQLPIQRRPRIGRLVVVDASITLALWVLAKEYLLGEGRSNVASVIILVAASLVFMAVQVVAFQQSAGWADQLHDNLGQLEAAHGQLRQLLDDLPEAVVVLSSDGNVLEANERMRDLSGRTDGELFGRPFTALFRRSERAQLRAVWDSVIKGEGQTPPFITFDAAAGGEVVLEADANVPVRNPERIVVALRDVTPRIAESRRLELARERFRLAFHNAPTGMALSSMRDGRLIDVNESLVRMLGRSRDELLASTIDDISHPDERGQASPLLSRVSSTDADGFRVERRFLRGDGGTLWARTWVSLMDDGDGDQLAIAHIEDVTEQRRTAERMEWAATHDLLTGLPNRFRFLERLSQFIESDERGTVAVLFVDIDNFKVINDSLGHDAGDQLLRTLSERLRTVVRDRDMLGRFGGDEFIVMLRDLNGTLDPVSVAERLRAEIANPIVVDGAELFVTASIGITVADREGISTSEMLRDADAAMYRAKARGRDCVEVYSPGTHDASMLNLRTTNELRRGIERGEIVPYYQPIVMLDTGDLVGFEVLARWRHPDRGLLGADKFLPMAEETGLIAEVGAAVLRASLAQLGVWRQTSGRERDLSLSVNISARQLTDGKLVELVAEALGQSGVPAASLWLEITETALMADVKAATVALRELRGLGLHLAVDDFGTGYSSLTYLKRFPVEAIKVDRSFVAGLGIDAEDSTIVDAVVKLGHSLNLRVVAEGVETPLQLARLRELGCDRAQGFLFGRPRPADLVEVEYSLVGVPG